MFFLPFGFLSYMEKSSLSCERRELYGLFYFVLNFCVWRKHFMFGIDDFPFKVFFFCFPASFSLIYKESEILHIWTFSRTKYFFFSYLQLVCSIINWLQLTEILFYGVMTRISMSIYNFFLYSHWSHLCIFLSFFLYLFKLFAICMTCKGNNNKNINEFELWMNNRKHFDDTIKDKGFTTEH